MVVVVATAVARAAARSGEGALLARAVAAVEVAGIAAALLAHEVALQAEEVMEAAETSEEEVTDLVAMAWATQAAVMTEAAVTGAAVRAVVESEAEAMEAVAMVAAAQVAAEAAMVAQEVGVRDEGPMAA
jgi:hypothetical protein